MSVSQTWRFWLLLVAVMLLCPVRAMLADEKDEQASATATAETEEEGPTFLRVLRDDDDRPQALQTSVARYVKRDNDGNLVQVDLVGAVHIGEGSYYESLNERFRRYDAVLFELVAPEGFEVPEGGRVESQSAVGGLQNTMKNLLRLQFQLDMIDYSQDNMVHADMTPEEFSRTMSERGESTLSMFFRMMGASLAMQGRNPSGSSDLQLFMALLRRDDATMKRLLAEQFLDMESAMAAINGPDGRSTIITERNAKAFEVLEREIAAGKEKLAVFYGAGHLEDMHERLEEMGFKATTTEWLDAWEL